MLKSIKIPKAGLEIIKCNFYTLHKIHTFTFYGQIMIAGETQIYFCRDIRNMISNIYFYVKPIPSRQQKIHFIVLFYIFLALFYSYHQLQAKVIFNVSLLTTAKVKIKKKEQYPRYISDKLKNIMTHFKRSTREGQQTDIRVHDYIGKGPYRLLRM